MDDTIRMGEEALARSRRSGEVDWIDADPIADAFEAALKILRGEDEEAADRAGMAFLAEISETPWNEVTDAEKAHWSKRALLIVRAAGGIGEGEDATE